MSLTERIALLRAEMKRQNLAAFLIPRTDEFQNEYVPANAERLARRSLARSKDFIMRRLRRDPRLMSGEIAAGLEPLPPRLVYGAGPRAGEVTTPGR